jgi:hypothetical protein
MLGQKKTKKNVNKETRARICKPFKEPRNRFPAWRAMVRQSYLTYRPAPATLAGGIDSWAP